MIAEAANDLPLLALNVLRAVTRG